MTFGKHKGSTLEEIYVEDRDYLNWCLETFDDSRSWLREKIEDCIQEMKNVRIY